MVSFRVGKYSSYYFYSNNEYFRHFIRIFRFLPKIFKYLKYQQQKNWVEITEYHVLVRVCTQEGQQITKLEFLEFLCNYFGKFA
jgi:hypothetical protein